MAKAKAAQSVQKPEMPILDPDHVEDDLFDDVAPDPDLQQLVFQHSADGQLILPGSEPAAEDGVAAAVSGIDAGNPAGVAGAADEDNVLTVSALSTRVEPSAVIVEEIPARRVTYVMLKIPLMDLCGSDNSYKTNKVNVSLDAVQATTLRSLTDALNRCDRRTDDGKHVAKEVHAIRWFLDQIAEVFAGNGSQN